MIALLTAALFGLFYFVADTNNSGSALGCPFMNTPTLCAMNPFEHIAVWQNMFAASIPGKTAFLFALALVIALVASLVRNFERADQAVLLFVRPHRSISQKSIARNSLQEAFSGGILHSKIF